MEIINIFASWLIFIAGVFITFALIGFVIMAFIFGFVSVFDTKITNKILKRKDD